MYKLQIAIKNIITARFSLQEFKLCTYLECLHLIIIESFNNFL